MIEVVSATRLSESVFWYGSALGASIRRLFRDQRLAARVAFENRRGLPAVFNERIETVAGPDILVFVHDDVWLDDYFLADRVIDGLGTFDVIGVAGNRRRVPGQPAWAFVGKDAEGRFVWDDSQYLSGALAHGEKPFGAISVFGHAPSECELLDGVFLAARRSALLMHGVRFDPSFDFHFYDLDFCRSAKAAGLRLGTWPIAMTHQSEGAFGSAGWNQNQRRYLDKWGS